MLRFEWNENKNDANNLKHGILFEEARTIWMDKKSMEFVDHIHSVSELRLFKVGECPSKGILLVIFCEREEGIIRIISARKANQKERIIYERQLRLI